MKKTPNSFLFQGVFRRRTSRPDHSRNRFAAELNVTPLENRLLLSGSGLVGTTEYLFIDPAHTPPDEVSLQESMQAEQATAAFESTDPDSFAGDLAAWLQANSPSLDGQPMIARLAPQSGTYSGLSLEIPDGVTVILDGSAGNVHFTGASPALIVSGNMIISNASFQTSTDDPTIIVQAGAKLTLINSVVHESDLFNQSAILVQTGGMLDLSSDDNLINVRGDGQLITWNATQNIEIVGNRLAVNGVEFNTATLADNFQIENRITHALDQSNVGQVRWVNQQLFVTQQSGSLARAVAIADSGDTVHVAAGTFVHTGQLNINRSMTIIGAGQDETIVMSSGQATSTELRTVQINAADVTIESMTLAGWTTLHTNATIGNGYLVWLDTAANHTTFHDVRFHGEDIRVAIYLGTRNDFTITHSLFTGTYFRAAIRGAGERMLISHNRFEESHYWYSPIYMEYGAPTSGEISFNYFVSRVGVNNTSQGFFKSDGTGLYAITNFQPNRTTADGLRIVHNTFHFQDADLVNELGNQPIAEAIHIDPLLPASGPIEIRDNIFQGYAYTGPQPTGDPRWQPLGGIVDGALEFDGVDDFGWFVDPDLNIGNSGSLSLWVKLDEMGRQQTLIHGAMEVQIDASNRIYFYANKANSSNVNDTLVRSAAISSSLVGTWMHIAITWDLGSKTGNIYVNGAEIGYSTYLPSKPNWNIPNPTAGQIFYVGSDPSSSSRWLNGTLDDIAFFDTALNAVQVAAINAGGLAGDSVAATGPSGNLVLHWTLDQSTDRVATSTVRNINLNLVPNGVPLEATDTALWRDGQGIDFGAGPTGALEFDGLSNFATFTDPNLNIGTNGSMTMWVKVDSFGRQQTLMHGALEVQIDASRRIYFYANKANSGNVNDTLVRSAALSSSLAGTWMHIAITWDLGTKTGRIYVNGAEIGYSTYLPSKPNWNVPNPTAGEMFFLGNDPTAATWGTGRRFLDGLMDDVALFDTTLTQSQIGLIRSDGVSETFAPVAHWNFDVDQVDGIYSGVSATTIPLELYREPPPAPLFGYAINASANTVVTNNVFFENDIDYNPIVNDVGDNLFGDPVFNLLRTVPDPAQPDYQVGFGAMATYSSSEYLADSFTLTPHVGAYQGNPGLFGSGDLIVRGSSADDLLVISDIVHVGSGVYTAEARYVRDVDGPNQVVLDPILLVDLTGVMFNGELGDDHFVIVHPVDKVFTPNNGIVFNGGTGGENSPEGNSPGDLLELRGGMTDAVSYQLVNDRDGLISYNGNLVITYTGVEPMIDTIVANDRDFVWQNLSGPIRLINESTPGLQRIEFDTDQQLQFLLPVESLEIRHLGSGAQAIEILSLDPTFVGDLALYNTGDVTIATEIHLDGGMIIVGDNVTLQQSISTGRAIAITAANALLVNGNLDADDATITFLVNQDGSGSQGFTQTPGTTIRTDNATTAAVMIEVLGTGDARLSSVQTGIISGVNDGWVTITVGGAIINHRGDGVFNLNTSRAVLEAASGIGSPGTALQTEIRFLEAYTSENYLWINERDDLRLDGVYAIGNVSGPTVLQGGPAQIVIRSTSGVVTILNGTIVQSNTGQISNSPPLLRLVQNDPSDSLVPGDPTQEVSGTLGGIETLGDNLEQGVNFRIIATWDDGVVSVLDFPTADEVTTDVTGTPVLPKLRAGDTLQWLIDADQQSTASIIRGTDTEGPIHVFIQRTYPLAHLQTLRNPEVVSSFVTVNDDNILLFDASGINMNRTEPITVITSVSEELLRLFVVVVIEEPPIGFDEMSQPIAVDLISVPTSQINVYDDGLIGQAEDEEEVAKLYLVRVLPDGKEGEPIALPLAELRDLSQLLDRLKVAPIPSGLYRLYYQEPGLPPQQVLEFRKSGNVIGDPVRESGRGSNPSAQPQNEPQREAVNPSGNGQAPIPSQIDARVMPRRHSAPVVASAIDNGEWAFDRVARQLRNWQQ